MKYFLRYQQPRCEFECLRAELPMAENGNIGIREYILHHLSNGSEVKILSMFLWQYKQQQKNL
jgi:hypothetical protein